MLKNTCFAVIMFKVQYTLKQLVLSIYWKYFKWVMNIYHQKYIAYIEYYFVSYCHVIQNPAIHYFLSWLWNSTILYFKNSITFANYICNLAAPWPTLGYCWDDSLTLLIYISIFYYAIFYQKVTAGLITQLSSYTWPSAQ